MLHQTYCCVAKQQGQDRSIFHSLCDVVSTVVLRFCLGARLRVHRLIDFRPLAGNTGADPPPSARGETRAFSPSQAAMQPDKYIGECTALVQLIARRCEQKGLPGLLVLLDGEKAFDRVQHDWLLEVLAAMGFPPDFCDLIRLLYRDASLVMKVNGHCAPAFNELNERGPTGLPAQPAPVHHQPFIEDAPDIEGVSIPGPRGRGTADARSSSYADDLGIFESYATTTHSLPGLQRVITTYELASGAAITNWDKTEGLRLSRRQSMRSTHFIALYLVVVLHIPFNYFHNLFNCFHYFGSVFHILLLS